MDPPDKVEKLAFGDADPAAPDHHGRPPTIQTARTIDEVAPEHQLAETAAPDHHGRPTTAAPEHRPAETAAPELRSVGNIRVGDTLKVMNKAILRMAAYDGEHVRALEQLEDGSWLVGLLRYGCEVMVVVKPQDLQRVRP